MRIGLNRVRIANLIRIDNLQAVFVNLLCACVIRKIGACYFFDRPAIIARIHGGMAWRSASRS